ncbi:MAG: hypothetical protein ACSHXL_00555 [Bacteroidota bacterium]
MLEKQITQDKIEVVNTGDWSVLQVRTKTAIIEDGAELSSSYHRHVVAPTDDLSNESDEVTAIANAVFTQEMKDAYTAAQEIAE